VLTVSTKNTALKIETRNNCSGTGKKKLTCLFFIE
jgi:hypothetical protein